MESTSRAFFDGIPECPASPFVFVSERRSPFTKAGFARMIERAAAGAGLGAPDPCRYRR
jgi:hypothetical protein